MLLPQGIVARASLPCRPMTHPSSSPTSPAEISGAGRDGRTRPRGQRRHPGAGARPRGDGCRAALAGQVAAAAIWLAAARARLRWPWAAARSAATSMPTSRAPRPDPTHCSSSTTAHAHAALARRATFPPRWPPCSRSPPPRRCVHAETTHQGVDWQTRKATLVAEAVMAGATRQGRSTFVWAVFGNGTFGASMSREWTGVTMSTEKTNASPRPGAAQSPLRSVHLLVGDTRSDRGGRGVRGSGGASVQDVGRVAAQRQALARPDRQSSRAGPEAAGRGGQ